MQKDIYFSEKNINIGEESFYSPWEIYLSEFPKWKPLVRGVFHPLRSVRLKTWDLFFADISLWSSPCSFSKLLCGLQDSLWHAVTGSCEGSGKGPGTVSGFLLLLTLRSTGHAGNMRRSCTTGEKRFERDTVRMITWDDHRLTHNQVWVT